MERYGVSQLYHMKDEIRFREIYDGIIASAKIGHKEKAIWWIKTDNPIYLKNQIRWYFYGVKIEEPDPNHIIVSWELE